MVSASTFGKLCEKDLLSRSETLSSDFASATDGVTFSLKTFLCKTSTECRGRRNRAGERKKENTSERRSNPIEAAHNEHTVTLCFQLLQSLVETRGNNAKITACFDGLHWIYYHCSLCRYSWLQFRDEALQVCDLLITTRHQVQQQTRVFFGAHVARG